MHLTTLLAILQQSEYNYRRFAIWYQRHQTEDLHIEPEKWTPKLNLIETIVTVLIWLPVLWRFKLALWLTQPGEMAIRRATYAKALAKLKKLRATGLTVVAIAGSYGKTSTKHILAHTLASEAECLMTPRSINTMLGISQIILNDLKPSHKLFICELGEFNPGDLRELTEFIKPDFGVLTPIGHQHLELLGSFDQIVAEFRGFAEYFASDLQKLLISNQNLAHFAPQSDFKWYGADSESEVQVSDVQVSRAGTEYQVRLPGTEPLSVFMPLFGEHQAVNTLPTFWLGQQLGFSLQKLANNLSSIPYIERRHEPTFAEPNILILDNGYNTNPDSVKESLKLLNQLKATHRIMITAGFVEQGASAIAAHETFGQLLASQVDYVGLFNAPYADAIRRGFSVAGGDESHIVEGRSQTDVTQKLQAQIIPGSVIIYEGGYQELYN